MHSCHKNGIIIFPFLAAATILWPYITHRLKTRIVLIDPFIVEDKDSNKDGYVRRRN